MEGDEDESRQTRRHSTAPSPPINVRAQRSMSGMVYDRKLESFYDVSTGSYRNRLHHSRVSLRSKDSRSPRPFFSNGDLARGEYSPLNEHRSHGKVASKTKKLGMARRSSSKLHEVEMPQAGFDAKTLVHQTATTQDYAQDFSSFQGQAQQVASEDPGGKNSFSGSIKNLNDSIDANSDTEDINIRQASTGRFDVASNKLESWENNSDSDISDDDADLLPPNKNRRLMFKDKIANFIVKFCEGQRSWIFLMVLGVITTILAWVIDEVSDLLQQARGQLATIIGNMEGGFWLSYLFYISWALFMAPISSAVASELHPQASGSGIPQLKSLMAGYHMEDFLGLRMLLAKSIGVVLALGSGLHIGKEGPFVCIAASVAALLMKKVTLFWHMETNVQLHRDALSAACAVGVAATFGAPIGGVLFAIEVTSSLYQVSSYWKGFFAAVSGAVVFKQLQASNIGRARLKNLSALFSTQFDSLPYHSAELPLFVLLGILAGVCAASYLHLQAFFFRCRRRIFPNKEEGRCSLHSPLVLVAGVASLTAIVTYPFGNYMTYGLRRTIDDLFHEGGLGETSKTYADDWISWAGRETGGSESSGSEESIQHSIGLAEGSLLVHLVLYISIKFVLSAATQTLPVPFGVIVPVFGIGAALGRLFGELLYGAGATMVTPGGYAVVGAAAFTAGVTHTVSVAVIVFELTSQLSYMLPVLLGVLIGRMVSTRLSSAGDYTGGIFSQIGQQLNLNQDPVLSNDSSYVLSIEHVLKSKGSNVTTPAGSHASFSEKMPPVVPRMVSQKKLQDLLAADQANNDEANQEWGVVEDETSMIFLGTVSRRELEDISLCKALFQTSDEDGHKAATTDSEKDENATKLNDSQLFVPIVHRRARTLSGSNTAELEVDLVASELLDLDYSSCIKFTEPLSECIMKFATTHARMLFLLRRGRLVGSLTLDDMNGY